MKLLLVLLVTALLSLLIGQEAKIIIVEKPDSQRLKRAYEKYKAAQAEWSAIKSEVAKAYTDDKGKTMEGWEKVQFSYDFRAIVPEATQYSAATNRWGTGCITLTNSNAANSLDSNALVNTDLVISR